MSSFICSDNHFKKLRQNTYDLIMSDKYILYEFNMDYHTDKEDIKSFVNDNIYKLYKLNVASVNAQYRYEQTNSICDDYENNIGNTSAIVDKTFNSEPSMETLIGLYNAYRCLDYQIELPYDKRFVDIIQKAIAKHIVDKVTDYYEDNGCIDVNRWEYE